MQATAEAVILQLGLQPHPEGGWYRETWRAQAEGGVRSEGTAIHYLLQHHQRSHWHRVDATEVWFYQGGGPLRLQTAANGKIVEQWLGPNTMAGEVLQIVIAPGEWQAADTNADWALAACVVVPGFEFSKFELAPPGWEPSAASCAPAPPIVDIATAQALAPSVRPPRRRTVVTSTDGVRLVGYEWGVPAGPAILFIHGSYQSALSWMKQVSDPQLTSKYRMVAFDLRGHGASDKPDGPEYYRSPERWAGDVSAVLDGLDLDRPVVVAWSYGARVLNDYLQANGDSRLGGVVYVDARSTSHGPPDPAGAAGEQISRRAASEDPATFIAGTREFLLLCLQRRLSTSDVDLLTLASMQTPQSVRQAMAGRSLTYEPVLRAIRVPALVVHGEADRVVSPAVGEFTHAMIAGSHLSIYPGVGHSPFLEDSGRFNTELDAFASRVVGAHSLEENRAGGL